MLLAAAAADWLAEPLAPAVAASWSTLLSSSMTLFLHSGHRSLSCTSHVSMHLQWYTAKQTHTHRYMHACQTSRPQCPTIKMYCFCHYSIHTLVQVILTSDSCHSSSHDVSIRFKTLQRFRINQVLKLSMGVAAWPQTAWSRMPEQFVHQA